MLYNLPYLRRTVILVLKYKNIQKENQKKKILLTGKAFIFKKSSNIATQKDQNTLAY